jgi:hypothetical protein
MFCPRCGTSDLLTAMFIRKRSWLFGPVETYCRQCGILLPDLSKPIKPERPPEEHITTNTVLSVLTIITSFSLAFLLYLVLAFKPETHPLIYVTAGLLLVMGGWHIQTLVRTQMLKRQWKHRARRPQTEVALNEQFSQMPAATTERLLEDSKFERTVPASVTENTTRHLAETPRRHSR